MLKETGFCSGIENYSRHLTGLEPGKAPYTLIDFFGDDFLMIVDESHITIPQVRGMYAGDRSRKQTLVDFGFRLPSALDNRPLNFDEFEERIDQMLFVSATPNVYEGEHEMLRAEQIIRPTGLLDPPIDVRPVEGQIDDLISEINKEVAKKNKVLVQGCNMVTKHTKQSPANPQGGIVNQEAPIDISNVMLVVDGKATRVGFEVRDGKKVRVAKATGKVID